VTGNIVTVKLVDFCAPEVKVPVNVAIKVPISFAFVDLIVIYLLKRVIALVVGVTFKL
jgi:hypothetical protein